MSLRPFFGYYGGKWRDAPAHYPAPVFDVLVEPFAGSAGYALRYPGRRVILCELDPIVAGVWRYLLRVTIAGQLWAIRHWQIREGSYLSLDVAGSATWFIDPPYQLAGVHYRCGSSAIDYPELGAWCMARRGQVIVCEATGASWLPFEALGDVKTTRRGRRSGEASWLGGTR